MAQHGVSGPLSSGIKVALTGGTGFLGYHIAEAFSRVGASLRVLARPRSDRSRLSAFNVEFVDGDLSDAPALRALASGCRVFVHAGGLTQAAHDAAYEAVNVKGTALALAAAKAAGVESFILMSSLAVAGPSRPGGPPLKEEDPPRPLSGYGRSKAAAEALVESGGGELARRVILRPGAIYGPYDRAFLAYFRMVARGFRPVLGRGSRVFQAVYAGDVAEACLAALAAPQGTPRKYFINPRPTVTWEKFGQALETACGRKALALRVPEFLVRPNLLSLIPPLKPAADRLLDLLQPEWVADPGRSESELGWSAAVDLAQGLRKTREWYFDRGWL